MILCFVQIKNPSSNLFGEGLNNALCLIFLFSLVPFPFYTSLFIFKYKSQLASENRNFDSLTLSLKTKKVKLPIYWSLFCLKRLFFAFLLTQIGQNIVLCLFLLLKSSILLILYFIKQKPFKSSQVHKLELFNEFCIYLYSLVMLSITAFQPYEEAINSERGS